MINYEISERNAFNAQINAINADPIDQESAREFDSILRNDCTLVTTRIDWLIQGCYGKGSYDVTREVIMNKRMNRHAWLFQTIAALEFNVKASKARAIWNALDKDTQSTINYDLSLTISDAVRGIALELSN